jgi:hypothetical protein
LQNIEVGQYSCTKLLREMEAALTESNEEDLKMAEGDDELIRLPESWLGKILQAEGTSVLQDNLYELPDV